MIPRKRSVSVCCLLHNRPCGTQPIVQARAGIVDRNNANKRRKIDRPFVEVAFPTSKGTVHGMAELLAARCKSTSDCLQPFRFIALADEDHIKLRTALESLSDQTITGVPSSRFPSL